MLFPGEENGAGVPFQKIKDAVKSTGLSAYFLRNGCINGSIPHVKSGQTYYVNVHALMAMLNHAEYFGGSNCGGQ